MYRVCKLSYFLILFLVVFSNCSEEEVKKPIISTISPMKGDYGSEVTIEGSNFSVDINNDEVLFGNIDAKIISSTNNKLTFEVPFDAKTGPITLISEGESTTSSEKFVVTAGEWIEKNHLSLALDYSNKMFMLNGNIYIHKGQSLWEYKASDNTWTEKNTVNPDFDTPSSTWEANGKGYYFQYTNSSWQFFYEYNPQNDEWLQKEGVPFLDFRSPEYTFYIESLNKVFFVLQGGGVYSYDHTNEEWNVESGFPVGDEVVGPSYHFSVSGKRNGYIVLFNGDIWKFSGESLSWEKIPSNPIDNYPSALFTLNGSLYIGGSVLDESHLYYYNEAEGKWYRKKNLPSSKYSTPIFISDDNKVYWGYGTDFNDTYTYDWYEFVQ